MDESGSAAGKSAGPTEAPAESPQPVRRAVRLRRRWLDGGPVILDRDAELTFRWVEEAPGLYRITLPGGLAGTPTRVYIGESDNLRRRLSGNYRNPGSDQQTNQRVNALLREHLGAGGTVTLAVATAATLWLSEVEQPLDLKRNAGRLLAENAALVPAQAATDADIVNLG